MAYNETESGAIASLQVADFGQMDVSADFKLKSETMLDLSFRIKNESDDPVDLEVVPWSSGRDGEPVIMRFYPGWNPEIVREVKASGVSARLRYGR